MPLSSSILSLFAPLSSRINYDMDDIIVMSDKVDLNGMIDINNLTGKTDIID